jgi:hypothetical protein
MSDQRPTRDSMSIEEESISNMTENGVGNYFQLGINKKIDTLNSWTAKVRLDESHFSCRGQAQRRFAGSIGLG